jgi:L-malate glycosyltransferase
MNKKNTIAIIGPILVDNKSSGGEGLKLHKELENEGYTIYKRSGYRNKLLRLLDTLVFILFRRKKTNVIIGMVFSGKAFVLEYMVFVLARLFRIKVIAVLHGGALNHFYKLHPDMVTRLYNKCDIIVTPSLYLKQYFTAKGWPVRHIPNFVDNVLFPYAWTDPLQPKLLWVRAFHDIYNPDLAIRAIAYLKPKFPGIRLTMVGPDQGKLEHCKHLIAELDLGNDIDIVGYVPNAELNSYYKSHQIFVTTTRYESFGVALVEAASSGIPMVSTRVGEIPYMWKEDIEMIMAEDNNQDDFNKKTERLLNDEKLRSHLSKEARRKAELFTWPAVKPKWEQLLNN